MLQGDIYLQLLDDGVGVLGSLGLAAKITSEGLALGEGVEDGLLDTGGLLGETHVAQHHDGAKKESGRVGKTLAGNIGGGTVDSLEDGALVTNVTRGGETETTNETGAHVGENVTVEVGHDKDLVVVRVGVGNHLQAGVVEELGVELNVGEVLGDLATDVEEETIRHLHDGGLVDDADLGAANGLSLLEGEAENALRGLAGDELDALDNTIDNNVLNARVFTLGVLTDEDGVDVVVGGLEAGNRAARTQVGKEVEGTAERQVERDVALADGGGERTLEGNLVLSDVLNGSVGDGSLAVLDDGGDVDGFPGNGDLGSAEDVLDGFGDFGANAVTLDQADEVVTLQIMHVSRGLFCRQLSSIARYLFFTVTSEHGLVRRYARELLCSTYLGVLGAVVLGNTLARGRVESLVLWQRQIVSVGVESLLAGSSLQRQTKQRRGEQRAGIV